MHWRRGVTNIIFVDLCLWLFSFSSARFFPSPCMFSSFFFAVQPTVPHRLCFLSVNFFVDIVFMLSFVPLFTTNLCLFPHSFKVPFLCRHLSVMFFSSCRVANLAHHHLIENREDSGGGLSLPAFARVMFAGSPKARETTLIIH